MKVLCVQTKMGMGDACIYIPYLHAISKNLKTPVSILAKDSSRSKELFANDEHIDEIIELRKDLDGVKGFFNLLKIIKAKNFDKIFIFNGSIRYRLLALLSKIPSINQYPLGISNDVIFQTAKIFTEDILGETVNTQPKLYLKKKNIENQYYNFDRNYKHISLGISASGDTKRLPIKEYINFAEQISKLKPCKFYLLGGENDQKIVNEFLSSKVGKNAISLIKMKINDIMHVMSKTNLYVGNDTGFLHISNALNIKSVGIFMDSPCFSYSGYAKNIIPIVPDGETVMTTTHDTLGKERISLQKILDAAIKSIS